MLYAFEYIRYYVPSISEFSTVFLRDMLGYYLDSDYPPPADIDASTYVLLVLVLVLCKYVIRMILVQTLSIITNERARIGACIIPAMVILVLVWAALPEALGNGRQFD